MTKDQEIYEIKGDPSASAALDGKVSPDGNLPGLAAEWHLDRSAAAHPQIRFRDRISTADLYVMGDELMLHFYCPRCGNANRITSKQKRIGWYGRPSDGLCIETFSCTWPGCGLRMRVDNGVGKEE